MLYLFLGQDTFQSQAAVREFADKLSTETKQPASVFRFDVDSFAKSSFDELARAKSLFGGRYIIIAADLFANKDAAVFLEENLGVYASSENVFIFREQEINQQLLKVFKKYSNQVYKFDLSPPKFSKKQSVNLFHITDALFSKNKSRAWCLFQRALLNGIDAEEIFWKISWQIKNILLVKSFPLAASVRSAGVLAKQTGGPMPESQIAKLTKLHPFVVKKSLKAAGLYTKDELQKYSFELVKIYHNSRRGLTDFDAAVEKFLVKNN